MGDEDKRRAATALPSYDEVASSAGRATVGLRGARSTDSGDAGAGAGADSSSVDAGAGAGADASSVDAGSDQVDVATAPLGKAVTPAAHEPKAARPVPTPQPPQPPPPPRVPAPAPAPARTPRAPSSPRAPTAPAERTPQGQSLSMLDAPGEAMRHGQGKRLRKMAYGIMGMCVLVIGLLPLMPFPLLTKLLIGSSMAVVTIAAIWLYRVTAAPSPTDLQLTVPWTVLVLALSVGVVGFGVYSPAPLAFMLAVYYVGQRHRLRVALTVYVTGSLLRVGTVTAIWLDVLVDPGVIVATQMGPRLLLVTELLVQLMFAGAFWISRASQRATTETMEELQRATHAAAQREALLMEAREELERAMRAGGAGRFTDQVLGSFRLGAVLGRGGMGEVYDATRESDGERAAVKLIRAEALSQPGQLERFLREAEVTAKLDSPHVVHVLEIGDETAPLPYIAMERLVGHDLAFHLRERPRLPLAEVVDLIRQLSRGVDAAHEAGIIHRDLKPQNVFLHQPEGTPFGGGVWKILDFGVSKLRDQESTINPGHVVGTPAYMAPEQVRGRVLDGRADVYALGVIAFRTLTGELPFRGRDAPELMYNVAHAAIPSACARVPGLPRAVDAVLARALAKRAADRFAVAGDLAQALAQALIAP